MQFFPKSVSAGPAPGFVLNAPGFDDALELINAGFVRHGMEHAGLTLWYIRKHYDEAHWRYLTKGQLFTHPVRDIAMTCPITSRNYHKPRGYAGDAVTLDYIYGIFREQTPQPTGMANETYKAMIHSECVKAVRYRRVELARLADEAAARFNAPRVLSIAAGHMREFELSSAAAADKIGEWVAFEQDAESLAVVSKDYGERRARVVNGTIRDLIAGRMKFDGFHLTYAAGLFDYLPDPAAKRLVQLMCNATVKGGRVMVANFMPDIQVVGYMEAYMDWFLIYRTEQQMRDLFSSVKGVKFSHFEVTTDPDRNIAFATATIA